MNKHERENTIKIQTNFASNGTPTDPLGHEVYITVKRPDGTDLVPKTLASRESTGVYYYTFNTTDDDLLGIYTCIWECVQPIGGPTAPPIVQRETFQLVSLY